jgi:hypothetical protein
MTMMKKHNSQDTIYVYRIATLMALNLLTATAGGLGLLYLRQEISATAERVRATEVAIADCERRLQYVNVQIAEATSPEALKARAAQLALNLDTPTSDNVVHLAALAPASAKNAALASAPSEPIFVTFELALLKGGAVKTR